jgi:O-methyltransferase
MLKQIIRGFLKPFGLNLVRVKKNVPVPQPIREEKPEWPKTIEGNVYDLVRPYANYSPWLGEKQFHDLYNEIRQNTLVDIFRCFELWELAGKVHGLDPGAAFIEIGVWRGGTAAVVGKKLSQLNAEIPFYLADTYTGVKKSSDKDAFYFDNEHADTSEEMVREILQDKYHHYVFLNGIFPEDTAHLIPEGGRFGYCHIDVDVYNSASDVVDWIWDKLIPGGVIVFDDYGFHTCTGITQFVNEQKLKNDRMIIHNLNGHAIMVKVR